MHMFGDGLWGVLTFGLDGLPSGQVLIRARPVLVGWSGSPLGRQPRTPVVAKIVEQPLATPKPTDPISDYPLHAALLPERVCTEPLA